MASRPSNMSGWCWSSRQAGLDQLSADEIEGGDHGGPEGAARIQIVARRMIRVVLDTNIIVSALLQPLGPPAQVFTLAISNSFQFWVSGKTYAEYEEVISRPP